MAHIILTGATGTAGSAVLAYALSSPAISRISILSRRPVQLAENEPKAQVIIHNDFEQYPSELLTRLKGATGLVWAQGISSVGMKEDEYTKITVDYPLAAANALGATLQDGDKPLNFVYVSGEGADSSENPSSVLFARVKGRAENLLLAAQHTHPSLRIYNARPALINPEDRHLAERSRKLQDRLATGLGGLMERWWKSKVIPTDALARSLVQLALSDGQPIAAGEGIEGNGRLLRNTALRRLADLA